MLLKWLDPIFFKKLEILQFKNRRASLTSRSGDLFTTKRGFSIEFMDYKEYTYEDDYRYIDWNLYGRLDRLYIRLYKGERSMSLYIFLDASRSMALPKKDNKFEYAAKTALALAYVGLISGDRVKLVIIGGRSSLGLGRILQTPFYYGARNILHFRRFLQGLEPDGESDCLEVVQKTLYRNRDVGTAVLISDFWMEPEEYKTAISFLRYKNFDINVLNILDQSELTLFKRAGKIKVRDSETGREKIVFLSESSRRRYEQAIQSHREELRRYCLSNKALFVQSDTQTEVEDFVLRELPHMRLLR